MTVNYDPNTNTVAVTVRSLTDFICRGGDIGGYGGVSAEDGVLTHKRISDERMLLGTSECLTEVPLEYEFERNGINYRLSGRADGIWLGEERDDIIEEVKTVNGTFWGGAERIPSAHIAQGVLYAFMWCAREGKRTASVRITYAPKAEGKVRSFECPFSFTELKAESEEILKKYTAWAEYCVKRELRLKKELSALKFPFSDVREGQKDFMAAVVKASRLGKRALIQAPTGTGKTMASVFPSFKSLGAGYADRIFYLTQKSSTAEAAENAVRRLLPDLPEMRSITVSAKERICPIENSLYPSSSCTPELCPRAAGHYERVTDALWELVCSGGCGHHISAETVRKCADKYNVCPYELSLDAAEMCEFIICDCNYVIDPRVYFRRFFDKGEADTHKNEKYIFLCDEAHNLADRACDMYSASLKLSTVKKAAEIVKNFDGCVDGEATAAFEAVTDEILKMKDHAAETLTEGADGTERGYYISSEPFLKLSKAASAASESCGRILRHFRGAEKEKKEYAAMLKTISSAYSEFSEFSDSAEFFDRRHIAFAEIFGGDIKCSHLCLDPSAHINEKFSRAKSAILFSATLEPPDYFMRVLGCEKNCDPLELPSPYDPENLCLIAADKISTRLADRENSANDIVSMIYDVASAKTGNYICYLPSYKYAELISDTFASKYANNNIDIVVQNRKMREAEREKFLSSFSPAPKRSKVGFCVLGGLFSEGVDLPGDRLSGVVIVGVGLPQISAELNLRRDHFDRICERGHEFAYMFPGMNKVLQAAGRVIRGEDDRGVVLLIDDRFGSGEYKNIFPSHWSGLRYIGDERSLKKLLSDFWNRTNAPISLKNAYNACICKEKQV